MITNALHDQPLRCMAMASRFADWLYVDDHCRGILAVLRKGAKARSTTSAETGRYLNLEVVHQLLAATGKPETLISYVKDRPVHDRRYALTSEKLMRENRMGARHEF